MPWLFPSSRQTGGGITTEPGLCFFGSGPDRNSRAWGLLNTQVGTTHLKLPNFSQAPVRSQLFSSRCRWLNPTHLLFTVLDSDFSFSIGDSRAIGLFILIYVFGKLLCTYGPPHDCNRKSWGERYSAQMCSAFGWNFMFMAMMSCARAFPY